MIIDMTKLVLLTLVLHFIADFNLQIGAKLNDMKQKRWWKEELNKYEIEDPDAERYRNDWLCALLIHSFVWSVITFAPLIYITSSACGVVVIIAGNMFLHAITDHIKANLGGCSLWFDQISHIGHILITYLCWYMVMHPMP